MYLKQSSIKQEKAILEEKPNIASYLFFRFICGKDELIKTNWRNRNSIDRTRTRIGRDGRRHFQREKEEESGKVGKICNWTEEEVNANGADRRTSDEDNRTYPAAGVTEKRSNKDREHQHRRLREKKRYRG